MRNYFIDQILNILGQAEVLKCKEIDIHKRECIRYIIYLSNYLLQEMSEFIYQFPSLFNRSVLKSNLKFG